MVQTEIYEKKKMAPTGPVPFGGGEIDPQKLPPPRWAIVPNFVTLNTAKGMSIHRGPKLVL